MILTVLNKEQLDEWFNEHPNAISIKGDPPFGSTYSNGEPITSKVNVAWECCDTGDYVRVLYKDYLRNMPQIYKDRVAWCYEANVRSRKERKVVSSACIAGGYLILGVRHWDSIMHSTADALGLSSKSKNHDPATDQGFVDNYGLYMGRKEAMLVAKAAGQILDESELRGDLLFSEDVW